MSSDAHRRDAFTPAVDNREEKARAFTLYGPWQFMTSAPPAVAESERLWLHVRAVAAASAIGAPGRWPRPLAHEVVTMCPVTVFNRATLHFGSSGDGASSHSPELGPCRGSAVTALAVNQTPKHSAQAVSRLTIALPDSMNELRYVVDVWFDANEALPLNLMLGALCDGVYEATTRVPRMFAAACARELVPPGRVELYARALTPTDTWLEHSLAQAVDVAPLGARATDRTGPFELADALSIDSDLDVRRSVMEIFDEASWNWGYQDLGSVDGLLRSWRPAVR